MAGIALVGFGSAGDIYPMLSLAQSLGRTGHRVRLLSHPHWRAVAEAAGIGFEAVGDSADLQAAISHPKFWQATQGFSVMWRYLLRPAVRPTFERLRELAQAGEIDVVVANPLAMGARLAEEALGLPVISAYLSPTFLRGITDPMTVVRWRMPRWLPDRLRHRIWSVLDRRVLDPLVRGGLDAVRADIGLGPVPPRVFADWLHGRHGGLALFPAWFAPRDPAWPAQVVQSDFPFYDGDVDAGLAPDIADFLEAGSAPVVFTAGTAMTGDGGFWSAALAAARDAGCRALLVGKLPAGATDALPAGVMAAPYAPFGLLLPRVRALVHHGGIGTTAQALRAGVPQVVVPRAFDQFDNGFRVEGFGAGQVCPPDRIGGLGRQIRRLLDDAATADACRRHAGLIGGKDPAAPLAAMITRAGRGDAS